MYDGQLESRWPMMRIQEMVVEVVRGAFTCRRFEMSRAREGVAGNPDAFSMTHSK